MVRKVVSGGQTGADQGGWEAARLLGLERGGQMPKGFLTEVGPRPDFAESHNATESHSEKYPPRTAHNVQNSDGTVLFGDSQSRGSKLTIVLCDSMEKPYYCVPYFGYNSHDIKNFRAWLKLKNIETLNVAGNRESRNRGIFGFTVKFLTEALREQL